MDDVISRQAVIELIQGSICDLEYSGENRELCNKVRALQPAQPDNQTNLCDSCDYLYPDCPSKNDDVIFGNGIGNDNICACNKYKPSVQPEWKTGKWIHREDMDHRDENGVFHWHGMCSECGFIHGFLNGHTAQYNYCPNCGSKMEWKGADEITKIVRCRDCKHNPTKEWFGCPMSHLSAEQRPEDAWCWRGEHE